MSQQGKTEQANAKSLSDLTEAGKQSTSKAAKQFVKFGLVGVLNTGVDFVVYTLLFWAGMPYLLAQCISFAAGTANSYVLNRYWTFGSGEGGGRSGQLVRHWVWNLVVLLLSLGLLYVTADRYGMHPLPAKVVVTVISTVINFVGSKLWVFRSK